MDSQPSPPESPLCGPRERKKGLRGAVLEARAALPSAQRHARDQALVTEVLRLVDSRGPRAVAAYSPVQGEPGGGYLVRSLLSVVPEVWLPVSGADGRLRWASCTSTGELRRGRFGIDEPTGPGTDSLPGDVELLLCPALACSLDGVRLGRGAGYFDRTLASVNRDRCGIVALVYASELLPELPAENHDEPVDGVLTQEGFHICLPDSGVPGT
ncbi:5-formyltetrahydrofolate cyclo-ligase [Corynebacterium pygosceleis]|uniref:5-formyltetrahydrofolate cyclo-ligase n=1 Tax=Corynebacterium pygosceleis TaxID=2800406 RepID=UPI0019035C2F|nr:5-formyltetrahydrofolate cyclo-ligase [Corynebacterium pygosceleis]MCK7675835.1 5-formyltetrahydrofolate cyclo-ligase [Corynebacterium pygosceleis]MCL0120783.1 5-formyltetrahydrofolate cyclo-ligase [Corynebacterium pygosceleis]